MNRIAAAFLALALASPAHAQDVSISREKLDILAMKASGACDDALLAAVAVAAAKRANVAPEFPLGMLMIAHQDAGPKIAAGGKEAQRQARAALAYLSGIVYSRWIGDIDLAEAVSQREDCVNDVRQMIE